MKYLKNKDGSMIVKWNEETELATVTELLMDQDASIGIKVECLLFTEDDAKDFIEIDSDAYMVIRDGKMEDYWYETAAVAEN